MVIKRAIFFDRDGILNKNIFYKKYKQYEAPLKIKDLIIDKNIIILKELQKKYLLFIITNQPAAAKNKTSLKEIKLIKNKFMKNLIKKKIKIKKYLVCQSDYSNKNNFCKNFNYCKFKKKNNLTKICKKPSNYLIEYCLKKYKIKNKKSWFIGDRNSDLLAAKKSKLKFVLVGKKYNLQYNIKYKISSLQSLTKIKELWVK